MNSVYSLLLTLVVFIAASTPASAQTYYFHNDHLGTPQVLTDEDQSVVWQAEYDPFGKATETVAVVEQNLRFPGQYLDRETGLHYNYFRDYDPATGRYLQSDPIGLGGGINTYGYAYQNPMLYTDPTGQFVPLVWWTASALWWTFQAVGTAYDVYGTIATFADECSSNAERTVAVVGLAVGVFLPLAGYASMGKHVTKSTALVRYDPDFAVGQLARGGNAKASGLAALAKANGWKQSQSGSGPIKFLDDNGTARLTIKRGSPRAPGSGNPHLEIRNAGGNRIDTFGNPVTRTSPANHTPIEWDLD